MFSQPNPKIIQTEVDENLVAFRELRRQRGFQPFIYNTDEIVTSWKQPCKINASKVAFSQLYGTAFRQHVKLYGKDGKIYFDYFHHILDGAGTENPQLLPPGKYCYTTVDVDTILGPKLEMGAKIAGAGSHWELIGIHNRPKVPGAGEFFIDHNHRLVFGTNSTGRYQHIDFHQQKNVFQSFFPENYFSAEDYYAFDGDQAKLVAEIKQRGLLHLDPELGRKQQPLATLFAGTIIRKVGEEVEESIKRLSLRDP